MNPFASATFSPTRWPPRWAPAHLPDFRKCSFARVRTAFPALSRRPPCFSSATTALRSPPCRPGYPKAPNSLSTPYSAWRFWAVTTRWGARPSFHLFLHRLCGREPGGRPVDRRGPQCEFSRIAGSPRSPNSGRRRLVGHRSTKTQHLLDRGRQLPESPRTARLLRIQQRSVHREPGPPRIQRHR